MKLLGEKLRTEAGGVRKHRFPYQKRFAQPYSPLNAALQYWETDRLELLRWKRFGGRLSGFFLYPSWDSCILIPWYAFLDLGWVRMLDFDCRCLWTWFW